MAASQDYTDFTSTRYQGETIELNMAVTLNAAPLPISNLAEIWFTAKLNEGQADPGVFQKTKTGGKIVATDDPGGLARITIDPADTIGLVNVTTLLCDLKIKETAATRETVEARGKLIIRPTPTKAII